jgi:subtilase family protein
MPIDPRMRDQTNLILNSLDHAAAFPEPGRWDAEDVNDIHYLYRDNAILVRERDAGRVVEALPVIFRDVPGSGEWRFEPRQVAGQVREILLPTGPEPTDPSLIPVPDVLAGLDEIVEPDVARPDHVIYPCPHSCPATEPVEVPPGTVDPRPLPGVNERCRRPCGRIPWPGCDGDRVSVSIVDTGLIPAVAAAHPWLAGVQGVEEDPYDPGTTNIKPYAGHGTFVAGVARCMAPNASVYVERAFDIAVGDFETRLPSSLQDALDRDPDILVFTFTTSTREDRSLLIFDHFYETRIRHTKGLVVLAPAGNDGEQRVMWPAGYTWVTSVGALTANGRDRADFSNHGKWVDLYAPGEALVNAYPPGTYVCQEDPNAGQQRVFQGMANWSGTSFSTPIVAGLIAARMSATGENAPQAADSLLRLACSQGIPGAGPALYPGQACCEACHCHD